MSGALPDDRPGGGVLPPPGPAEVSGGLLAVQQARAAGVERLFTLSGGHVFPIYDAAVRLDPPMPIVDTRHEATAVFAAEATARLTRRPGLAVLTAGPGVTNGVSAITTAYTNGVPLLVVGGRAPAFRWGSGSLQELDHPPLVAPVTKHAATVASLDAIAPRVAEALRIATLPHRGPVFLDVPMDVLFGRGSGAGPVAAPPAVASRLPPAAADLVGVAAALAASERPVLVLGSDVWLDGADGVARGFAETLGLPTVVNGMGRGVVPADSPVHVTRARGVALRHADLVLVAGTPLDFRLGFGAFPGGAAVVHLADAPSQVAEHVPLAASAAGDLTAIFTGVLDALPRRPDWEAWRAQLRAAELAARVRAVAELDSDSTPIAPARVYGELARVLDQDAVVIGDGGDFVSFAGRYVDTYQPGCWLDPGPFGCLGTGLGYAIAARLARPTVQVVLLLGDGAAGFSLMDVDTLVRHRLPVVLVIGNNGAWGLEKHPMRLLYGYDVAADLQPECRYDEVVRALGGGGELVREPGQLHAALVRAFDLSRDTSLPYCVNVLTDPAVAYPRSATLA